MIFLIFRDYINDIQSKLLPKVEFMHLDTCLAIFYIKQLDPTISFDKFNQQFVAHKTLF